MTAEAGKKLSMLSLKETGKKFMNFFKDEYDPKKETWLETRCSGSVPVNRFRIFIVGENNTGKTCLVDSLFDKSFREKTNSTDGISVCKAQTSLAKEDSKNAWTEAEHEDVLVRYNAAGFALKFFDSKRKKSEKCKVAKSYACISSDETSSTEAARAKMGDSCHLLNSKEAARFLKNPTDLQKIKNGSECFKMVWDTAGQDQYLATHSALLPGQCSDYSLCAYVLTFDLSKPRTGETKSFDFLLHWLSSIMISHKSSPSSPYLGEELGVSYPLIIIVATHKDKVVQKESAKFIRSQRDALEKTIRGLKCEKHIVKNVDDPECNWFFPVDNTKSGTKDPCTGVTKISAILDNASREYWKKKQPLPVSWVCFESELLLASKTRKVVHVDKACEIASETGTGIKDEKDAKKALRFFHELGVVFYFHDASSDSLRNIVFLDPQWLTNAAAAFVTSKEPEETKYQQEWRKALCSGKFNGELVNHLLNKAVRTGNQDQDTVDEALSLKNAALEALKLLDIICLEDKRKEKPSVMIPCMISKETLNEPYHWKNYRFPDTLPPPIVLIPKNVQVIPRSYYYRLVTKLLETKKYQAPNLSRGHCTFLFGNPPFILELLYYNGGKCIIMTMTPARSEKTPSVEEIMPLSSDVHQFLLRQIENVKQRGMSGLKLGIYYQVKECQEHQLLEDKENQVKHKNYWEENGKELVALNRNNKSVSEEYRRKVCSWRLGSPFMHQHLSTKGLWDVAKYMAFKWKGVARRLDILEYEIKIIQENHSDVTEQAYQMLFDWRESHPNQEEFAMLKKALCGEGLSKAAERLFCDVSNEAT